MYRVPQIQEQKFEEFVDLPENKDEKQVSQLQVTNWI